MSASTPSCKPEKLVIMSWAGGWGRALREAVSDPFSESTGIAIEHVVNVGLALPPFLEDTLDAGGRPPFDVIWSNGVPALRAARQHRTVPLDPEAIPELEQLRPRARPIGQSGWPVVNAYVVYYVLAYRKAAFPESEPESWDELLDPRHAGRIALYPGGNGFFPVAQVMGGGQIRDIPDRMDACWDYVKRVRPQIGELDYSIAMGERIRRGSLNLCFRALANALAFRDEGLDVRWVAPREGVSDTVDSLWIPRGVPDEIAEWAQAYIAFALRPDVQQHWCEALGAMPVHPDATIPAIFAAHPTLPHDADDHTGVLHVSEATTADYEQVWAARFDAP